RVPLAGCRRSMSCARYYPCRNVVFRPRSPSHAFHHMHGGFMSTFLRAMLLVMSAAAGLAACTEPMAPPIPPPKLEQPADSTSHAYTWEYIVLGRFGSSMSAVAADGDDNVWAVGDIDLGYEIAST